MKPCPLPMPQWTTRTTVEWDKDDLDALGILKVDVLALGMLTCLRKSFDLLRLHYGIDHVIDNIPAEERAVYNMISNADTIGVFQIESPRTNVDAAAVAAADVLRSCHRSRDRPARPNPGRHGAPLSTTKTKSGAC